LVRHNIKKGCYFVGASFLFIKKIRMYWKIKSFNKVTGVISLSITTFADENLAQKLQKELHQIDISTTNGIIQLRNTNRLDLDSIEEEHRRRELSFFVNWYDKSIIEVT